MADIDAGRLSIGAVADLTGFARDLRDKVDAEVRNISARIRAEVDASRFRRELEDAVDAAQRNVSVTIRATVNYQELRRDFQQAILRLEEIAKVRVGATLDYQELRRDLQRAILRLEAGLEIRLRVTADTTPLRDSIRRARLEAEANPVRIRILGDSGGAGAGILGALQTFLKPVALLALIGPVIGIVSALTGAVIALGGALAPLSGLLVAYPGILAAVGQGFATVKLATGGLSDAMKLVDDQQTKSRASAAGLTVEQYKQQKQLRSLSVDQLRFARYLLELRDNVLPGLKQAAARGLLPGAEAGLRGLVTLVPQVRNALQQTGLALGDTARNAGNLVKTGPFRRDFGTITGTNTYVVRQLGAAFLSLVSLARTLLIVGGPLIRQAADGARRWASYADQAAGAGRASGRLSAFFSRATSTAATLGRSLRNIGIILGVVFGSGAPLGRDLLSTFEQLTERGVAFVRTASGIGKIRGYFEAIRPTLTEVGRLFGVVVRGVASLGTSPQVAAFIAQIRTELAPAIGRLFAAVQGTGNSFSGQLISTLTSFVNLIAQLAQSGGGLVLYLQIFGFLARILVAIIRDVPGMQQLVSAIVALLVVTRVVRAFSPLLNTFRTLRTLVLGTQFQSFIRGLFGAGTTATGLTGILNRLGLALNRMVGYLRTAVTWTYNQVRAMAVAAWGRFVSLLATLGRALRAAAVASRAFALSLLTNPIFLVVAAIVALVAAFILLYKNSETFRRLVSAIWGGIKSAAVTVFGAIKTFITDAWHVIYAVGHAIWTGISTFIKYYLLIITTVVKTYIAIVQAVITNAWNVIKFVTGAIWAGIKFVVTNAINGVRLVIETAMHLITSGWNLFWSGLKFVAGLVFGGIKSGIDLVWNGIKSAFRLGVDAVKRVWDGLKEIAAAPVRFVVNTVYNHGIRAVWNKVAGFVHLPGLPEVKFARGGPVPQPPGSRRGKDSVRAMLAPGEHVWTEPEVRAAGGHSAVAGLRSRVKRGGARVMANVRQGVAYAASGGGVDTGGGSYDTRARAEVQRLTGSVGNNNPVTALEQVGSVLVGYLRKGAAAVASAALAPIRALINTAIPGSGYGKTVKGLGTRLIDGVVSFIKGKERDDPATGSTGGKLNAAAKGIIRQALAMLGLPASWQADEELLISRESSGNATIQNPIPVGPGKEHATGFAQMLMSTFRAYALPGHGNILNALDNMLSSLRYQVARWHGPSGIPGLHSKNYVGYALGGTVDPRPGGSLVRVAEAGRRETIVDTASLNEAVRQLAGRSGVVQHIYPSAHMDERELAALVDRELAWSSR